MNKNIVYTTAAIAGIAFLLLVLINIFRVSYPITITNTNRTSELSVIGEGKVDVVPDTTYVDLGITINDVATVEEAQKTLDQTNNKIIEAVKKLGIKKEDITTRDYSIYPNYKYEGAENKQSGYNGSVNVNIKFKNVQLASKVIEEATKAGANQVQGTRFTVEDPAKYREEAREKAIANAKEQAQKLAKNLGIRLGKITNIVESSGYSDGPIPMLDKAALSAGGMGGGGPELEPGSQTITSVVTLYFEKN